MMQARASSLVPQCHRFEGLSRRADPNPNKTADTANFVPDLPERDARAEIRRPHMVLGGARGLLFYLPRFPEDSSWLMLFL